MQNISIQPVKFLHLFVLGFISVILLSSPAAITAEAIEHDGIVDIRFSSFDNKGNIVLVGNTEKEDVYLGKFDGSGNYLWSDIFGGSGEEIVETISFDKDNNVILSGVTYSSDFDMTEDAEQMQFGGGLNDLYIRKWQEDGELLWSTYLGGDGSEDLENEAFDRPSMLINSDQEIILLGKSSSSNFPTLNAFQETKYLSFLGEQTFEDLTISKLDDAGNLLWSSYLGGLGTEYGFLSFDLEGNIVIRGASVGSFLEPINEDLEYTAMSDIYITKINQEGELLFTSFVGGDEDEWSFWSEIDSNNDLILTGTSQSPNYPTTPDAFQTEEIGRDNVVLTKIDEKGQLLWSTYFGGSGFVESSVCCTGREDLLYTVDAPDIRLDSQDDIILTFYTESSQLTTKNAYIENLDQRNPFISKFASNGTYIFGTYLRGIFSDAIISQEDDIFISAQSLSIEVPLVNAIQSESNGGLELILTKLLSNGSASWSTFFGGNGNEKIIKSSFSTDGNILLVGTTTSVDLPGAKNVYGGVNDLFVSKINFEDGSVEWTQYMGGSDKEMVNRAGLLFDGNGNILVLGRTQSNNADTDTPIPGSFEETIFMTMYNSDGQREWSQVILPEARVQPIETTTDFRTLILFVGIAITGASALYLNSLRLKSKSFDQALLNQNMSNILKPLFNSHPKLIHIFGASKIFDKKVSGDGVESTIPAEIMEFKYYMQPVRLSIIKLLDENMYLTTVQIKDHLGIAWSEVMNHIDSLKKKKLITVNQEFIDGATRTVISPENVVITKYHALKEVMMQFFEATPNLDNYLEYVTSIKLRSEDPELYPNDH